LKVIKIDAGGWGAIEDLHDTLLKVLEAPDWHGRNLDAFHDSSLGRDKRP
jgi:RNAse (barnase) inhibitor barstar